MIFFFKKRSYYTSIPMPINEIVLRYLLNDPKLKPGIATSSTISKLNFSLYLLAPCDKEDFWYLFFTLKISARNFSTLSLTDVVETSASVYDSVSP